MTPLAHSFSLSHLISVAVAPVVLITATAILLSGYTTKYTNIADRLRVLAAEYRRADTGLARRANLKTQMRLFHRRVSALWAASALLSLGLLSFLGTVLSVIFDTRQVRLGWLGAASLILGLVLMAGAVLLELYEIRLARLTVAGELTDIFADGES